MLHDNRQTYETVNLSRREKKWATEDKQGGKKSEVLFQSEGKCRRLMTAKEVKEEDNEKRRGGTKKAGLGRRRLTEVDRGRYSQNGEIERLERWQDDKSSESKIKKQEAVEAASEVRILGKVSACPPPPKVKTWTLHLSVWWHFRYSNSPALIRLKPGRLFDGSSCSQNGHMILRLQNRFASNPRSIRKLVFLLWFQGLSYLQITPCDVSLLHPPLPAVFVPLGRSGWPDKKKKRTKPLLATFVFQDIIGFPFKLFTSPERIKF